MPMPRACLVLLLPLAQLGCKTEPPRHTLRAVFPSLATRMATSRVGLRLWPLMSGSCDQLVLAGESANLDIDIPLRPSDLVVDLPKLASGGATILAVARNVSGEAFLAGCVNVSIDPGTAQEVSLLFAETRGRCDSGQVRGCYDGAPETAGIGGLCVTGETVCVDGRFTRCIGEHLPRPEVCNGLDDDCNGIIDDGAVCQRAGCGAACGPTQECCGGQCAEIETSSTDCGACGHRCQGENACCGGSCIDQSADLFHCGACGRHCATGETCCGGTCVDTRSNSTSCGACGRACDPGQLCCSSECVPTTVCTCDARTCPSGCCGPDGQCHAGTTADACGGHGEPCNQCTGSGCLGARCVACTTGCVHVVDGAAVCNPEGASDSRACGSGGALCDACGPGEGCSAGHCTTAARDVWLPVSGQGAPASRYFHTAVFATNEMIIWGGSSAAVPYERSGGRYDPGTDTWRPMSTAGAPNGRRYHTAVWTGSEMIVWGGDVDPATESSARYQPASDTWVAVTQQGAPVHRRRHSAIWTGREMIVWGGDAGAQGIRRDGGRYDPVADRWTPTSMTDAPVARQGHGAVWSGSEMIVWGGVPYTRTGARYDPGLDRWRATALANAPIARNFPSVAWTETLMLVAGSGDTAGGYDARRYDPEADRWTNISDDGLPTLGVLVSMGSEAFMWTGTGSRSIPGARYDPAGDRWRAISTVGEPAPGLVTAVWTGQEVVVWGAPADNPAVGSSGRYHP